MQNLWRHVRLFFPLALAACNATAAQNGIASGNSAPLQASYAAVPPQASPSQTYVLGPSDRVRIKVYGETDITGEYEIDSNGVLSIPLAGQVNASGLTTRQLEKTIVASLSKGLLRDPRVNVEVATYRPFYILGEVKRAGEYPYKAGLTVLDAVASAGGYTYRANENKVFIRRKGSSVEEAYELASPIIVYPGDNVRIPERFF